MTNRKLIMYYKVVAPSMFGRVVQDPDIARYTGADVCCDDIDSLLGWMIDVSPQPVDKPRVEIYSFSDISPGPIRNGEISFCPFCGAKIELQRVE